MKNKNLKIAGCVIAVIIGVIIALITPPTGLTQGSMIILGSLVTAIILWIINLIPDYAVGMMLCASWVIFKVLPFNQAFASFSSTSWWMIIGGLGIGVAVSSTGLMKRIALHVMKLFPSTFKGQTLAVMLAGVLVSPAIPSTNAKGSIAAPLSLSISDTMGYERKSKPSAGLFMAMFYGFVGAAPIFLSATFMNYSARGLMSEQAQASITWGSWLIRALPWALVFIVGGYFAINHFYKPEKDVRLAAGFIDQQIKENGKMTSKEKITAVVLVLTLILWILERQIGISSTVTAVVALSVLITTKVISVDQFKKALPWNSIIFIGCALNLSTVLPAVGINDWIMVNLGEHIQVVLSNPYLMVIALSLMVYLIRFVLVSLAAAVTIFVLMVLPLLAGTGIDPFVIAFITLTSVNIWVLHYQNPPFLTTYYAVDGVMATPSQTLKGSLIYMVLNIVGLLVSVPFWQLLGLL